MENKKNYSTVIDYIVKKFGFDKSKLNVNTSLSDIGLDGDDILDFLVNFFEEFDIEYKNTNYMDFIPPERSYFMFGILNLFGCKDDNSNEIFIKDLILSLEKKKWYKINITK